MKGRPKDAILVSPIVRRAFVGALKVMREEGENKGRHVMERLMVKWLSDDDPKIAMSAVKLVMEKETRVSGTVKHEHKRTISETEIYERFLSETQHLADSDYAKVLAGLRAVGAGDGPADESTTH